MGPHIGRNRVDFIGQILDARISELGTEIEGEQEGTGQHISKCARRCECLEMLAVVDRLRWDPPLPIYHKDFEFGFQQFMEFKQATPKPIRQSEKKRGS